MGRKHRHLEVGACVMYVVEMKENKTIIVEKFDSIYKNGQRIIFGHDKTYLELGKITIYFIFRTTSTHHQQTLLVVGLHGGNRLFSRNL